MSGYERYFQALAGGIGLLCAGAAWAAADQGGLIDLVEGENQVFAASRYRQSIAETPANVSVITREDIGRFGYRTIAEALSGLPGFYNAASQWPAFGLRGEAIPGDFGSRLLYMVNGMPIYEPTYGGFFSEYLDIDSIERIEVVRGPGSALYGNGAVEGIINLITRSGETQPLKNTAVEAAGYGSYKAYGSTGSVSKEGADTFVSLSGAHSDGRNVYLREYDALGYNHGWSIGNDKMDNLRLFGRAQKGGAWAQTVVISLDQNDPLASYQTTFNSDRLLLREWFSALEAGTNAQLSNDALVTGRVYFFNIWEKGNYPSNSVTGTQSPGTADFINVSDLSSSQLGTELRYDQFVLDHHHVLAGFEMKHIEGRFQAGNQPGLARAGVVSASGSPSYNQYSLFGQDTVIMSERGELFLGARYDAYHNIAEGIAGHLSPRIAYVHQFDATHNGKLSYGEAYRIPTLYESQYTDGQPAAQSLWTNPLLKPETTRTLEALLESTPNKDSRSNVGPFLTRIKNTPVQVPVPVLNGVACGGPQCLQYQNSNDMQEIFGIEASTKQTRPDGTLFYTSATVQRGYRWSDGAALPSSPNFLWKGGVSHPLPWEQLTGAIEANFVSRAKGRINPDGSRTTDAPAYMLFNLSINLREKPNAWRATFRVDNLFNRTTYTVASRELAPVELVPGYGRTMLLMVGRTF